MLAVVQSPQTLQVSVGQFSSAGRKPQNQDFYGAMLPEGRARTLKGIVLAQADGITPSPVSAQAAQTAVGAFLEDYYATPDSWSVQSSARRVIDATNGWLFAHNDRSSVKDKDAGLVCTFDAVVLKGRRAHLFHVGDGRIWRARADLSERRTLECLTKDHRMQITEQTGYLSRALGIDQHVEIDHVSMAISPGDLFILTTDGVHDHLSAQEMLQLALGAASLDAAAKAMADQALAAGSGDNLTVQIARIDALPKADGTQVFGHGEGLPVPKALRAGDELDGWRIIRAIHSSSRSQVFQVIGLDGMRGALKVPSAEMASNADHIRRFLIEEWIARRVDSDHVLTAPQSEGQRSALYTVMTYLEGQTLRHWMASNPAPRLEQVQDILGQLASGLRAFHRREMLHQDLRPENIMIDDEGTVRIIDFGSVLVRGIEEAVPGVAGPMAGTFQYTAPEYLSGDAISWRSDQYSLGVIAYEMLTGKLPYGAAVARISNRQDQRRLTYTPARDHRPQVPLWLDDAVRRAVHPDPLRRYDALSEFITQLSAPPPAARGRQHIPLAQRSPAQFWQAVSAVLAIVVVWLLIDRLAG